jgi:hypothetical protein
LKKSKEYLLRQCGSANNFKALLLLLVQNKRASFMEDDFSTPLRNYLPDEELILWLIREDLKCRKFFDGLRAIGLEDSFYQPELGMLILKCAGFKNEMDEVYNFYYNLAGRHSAAVAPDVQSVRKEALQVYHALATEKNRRGGRRRSEN